MILLWAIGCSDEGFTLIRAKPPDAEPDIQVTPAKLAFPEQALGCPAAQTVHIENKGVGPLDVDAAWLEGADATVSDYAVQSVDTWLPPGAGTDVIVQFTPSGVGQAVAQLVVDSDDPDEPHSTVPIAGDSYDPTWKLDLFTQTPDAVDVLWVIDNSGSMWQERDRVTASIDRFFKWFEALDLDYHMGVVTTDIDNPIYSGRLVGVPSFVTPQSTDPQGTLALAINFGGLEMGAEAGLAASKLALSEPLLSHENAGFYRPDARLVIIYISDENDQSLPAAPAYVDFLKSLKPNPAYTYIAAIVGNRDAGCRGSCAGYPQDANPGNKYLDVSEAFNGYEGSICTCDLAASMEQMGYESTWYVRSFVLKDVPNDPTQIGVWVDGAKATGWTYDPTVNAVTFETAPAFGAKVVVRYPAATPCE